jgi:hypothetical protein
LDGRFFLEVLFLCGLEAPPIFIFRVYDIYSILIKFSRM